MPPPHPLRRVSTGSLSSLARSQDRSHQSPSGLDFLTPAITELVDEAATLAINTQKLNELHDALGTFNEAFAGWLYALKMNAFCVEWPEAPDPNSFARMEKLETLLTAQLTPPPVQPSTSSSNPLLPGYHQTNEINPADLTYATASSFDDHPPKAAPTKPVSTLKKAVPAPGASGVKKGPASAAMRKKRELEIAGYIDTLPLEYRGKEPAMRLGMESVIGKLMDNPQGLTINDFITPDLPQPKANKHLIALVAKKLVVKATVNRVSLYKWVGA